MTAEAIGPNNDYVENPSTSSISKTAKKEDAILADDDKVDVADNKISAADLKTANPNDSKSINTEIDDC